MSIVSLHLINTTCNILQIYRVKRWKLPSPISFPFTKLKTLLMPTCQCILLSFNNTVNSSPDLD